MRFTRLDNQEKVEVLYDLSNISLSGFDGNLMQKGLQKLLQKRSLKFLALLGKKRVSEILLKYKDEVIKFI